MDHGALKNSTHYLLHVATSKAYAQYQLFTLFSK